MNDIKPIVAKNIAALRTSREMTQAQLAEKLNYSDKAVSKWERGESLPDVAVLTEIADLFGVTLDYLVRPEHDSKHAEAKRQSLRKIKNRGLITGISIVLVWLVTTSIFVIISEVELHAYWLCFVYAAPATCVVWLVLNSIWFNRRRNFLIISLLMWSVLGSIYLTLLPLGYNVWLIFVPGGLGQIIIFLWSKLRYKSNT